ncbi:MAG: UvrD-helicase domain-containing protein, partial [Candidatus Omnitrophica bacterium]|nr:UvrD-helicase domain-containing protein [Candidatus Omnitrophota bacterium]
MTKAQEIPTFKPGPANQVLIVEASAGSGKTYELAKRYLQLLFSSRPSENPLENILAITFTNKAALEMKERIFENLKKIALDKVGPQQKDILDCLPLDKEAVRNNARLLMDEIIRNYNFFQVQTIDSFINSVISGCSFMLGLSSAFRIRHDFHDYMSASLDDLIDKAGRDKALMQTFQHFLRQYIFIENKTGWLPKQDVLATMLAMFGDFNTHTGDFAGYPVATTELAIKNKAVFKMIRDLAGHIPEGTNQTFQKGLLKLSAEDKKGFTLDELPEAFKLEKFPLNKGFILPQSTEKLWGRIHEGLKEICELEMYSLFNCYVDIFSATYKEFRRLSAKEDALFLEELNKQAQALFDEDRITVPELYYRLSLRLKHFLIDEFQDTSILQWMNLYPMIEEALSSGGTLFYVGDKKQAIFRFRGGEVGLFDGVKQRFGAYHVEPVILKKNFRSQKEIVEFNNAVFSAQNLTRFIAESGQGENLSAADVDALVKGFRDSQQSYKEENQGGFVKVEFVDTADKDELDLEVKGRLIERIRQICPRFGYQNIAILTRKNEDVAKMTEWLIENNIPVESEKTLNIRENPLVKEFISFLKFLNSPIDNLSFSSFLLGEIFQKASGLTREEVEDFLFQLNQRKRKEDTAYYYKEFRNKFPRVWDGLIEDFFKRVGFVPLYELILQVYAKFGVFKNFSANHGFFMKLSELVKDNEEEHPTIAAFLEYFDSATEDELYVNVARSDAVRIFTIHKAKGLGFGAVIIPFLEIEVKVGAARNRKTQNYVIETDEAGTIQLLRLKKEYTKYSPLAKKIYVGEFIKAFLDELNNIYVALTRAEYEMHIFIPKKSGQSHNLARVLIKEEAERGKRAEYPQAKQKKETPLEEILPCDYSDWPGLLKDEFIPGSQFASLEKIRRGEMLHYLFSQLGDLSSQEAKGSLQHAAENTALKYKTRDGIDELIKIAEKCLVKKGLKEFFFTSGKVFTEKEVVNKSGHAKRIDRLVITSNEAWAVDYKSTRENSDEHIRQVREYISIIQDLYPRHKVR